MEQGAGMGIDLTRLVLVTRPAQQAAEWVSKLGAQGVGAQALPLIGIAEAPDAAAIRQAWQAFREHAAEPGQRPQLMFVSPNAARCFFEALSSAPWHWPATARALATGPGTVAALRAAGVPQAAIVAPAATAAQFDSEHLWALIAGEDWPHQPTWIVRGEGGRGWLAETLRQAGATVAFVQAYARSAPQWGAAEVALLHAALARPAQAVWLISSSEALDHLPALLAQHAADLRTDWSAATALASHPRIAERCRGWGFGRVVEIRPTPQAVAQALGSAGSGG